MSIAPLMTMKSSANTAAYGCLVMMKSTTAAMLTATEAAGLHLTHAGFSHRIRQSDARPNPVLTSTAAPYSHMTYG